MFREIAVEPEALASWSDCRAILDKFVMGSGALISEFPGYWKRLVYQSAASSCRGVELARIEERLRELDKRMLIPSGRSYPNSKQAWLVNAIQVHHEVPFGGIICASLDDAVPEGKVVPAQEIKATHALFSGLGQIHVRRDSGVMVDAVEPLLRGAKHIKIIDAHFRTGAENGFEEPIIGILEQVRKGNGREIQVELHTETSDRRPTKNLIESGFAKLVQKAGLDAEIVVCFYPQGVLHNRFLLTNRGGVMWGTGLDEKGQSEKKTEFDDLFLLTEKMYNLHWDTWSDKE